MVMNGAQGRERDGTFSLGALSLSLPQKELKGRPSHGRLSSTTWHYSILGAEMLGSSLKRQGEDVKKEKKNLFSILSKIGPSFERNIFFDQTWRIKLI